jgi:hypothetical protein
MPGLRRKGERVDVWPQRQYRGVELTYPEERSITLTAAGIA